MFDTIYKSDNNSDETNNINYTNNKININITNNSNNTDNSESYLSNKTVYNFSSSDRFSYETRLNKKTRHTEFYNLVYEYQNDCLTAALEYNKDDVEENELCGSKLGRALSVNKDYHLLLLKGLVSIPKMKPGDTVWWHPDVIHAVEDKHSGKNYSNVVYVGATPYCKKTLDYTIKQSKKFLEGKSPPDFAAEDYEIKYKDRVKLKDLSTLAKKQLALEEWN